jgi:hypothetical protein
MVQALLLAALLAAQDPQPAARTVEDRVKELEAKLALLEKKRQVLSDENAALGKQISDGRLLREHLALQAGLVWVQRYAKPVRFTEAQSADLQELWRDWTKEDFEKPGDPGRWKLREDRIRLKLTPEQIPLLARRVREEREENAKRAVSLVARSVKLAAEKSGALEKAVLGRLSFEEGMLLPQAHPEVTANAWGLTLDAVLAGLSDPSLALTPQEEAEIRKVVGQWLPKPK